MISNDKVDALLEELDRMAIDVDSDLGLPISLPSSRELLRAIVAEHFQRWAQPIGYIAALKIADSVFEEYKTYNLKWWKRMDGTPILNDISVRMAKAFGEAIVSPPEPKPAQEVGDTWEDNAKYLLEHCPHSIRVREGGGPEDLCSSLVVTFQKMQSMLEQRN